VAVGQTRELDVDELVPFVGIEQVGEPSRFEGDLADYPAIGCVGNELDQGPSGDHRQLGIAGAQAQHETEPPE
jgi:hypothetical protein